MVNSWNRETTASRSQQARKSENHNRQSLQVLHRGRGEWQVRMVMGMSERRRQVHVQAQLASRVCSYFSFVLDHLTLPRVPSVMILTVDLSSFILKTTEQRAAEKALMDKSPLKTLTLEDFLESERHKLTGTLTPVTPESFAKWKKERLDKKAAEEEARKAREDTGRAMFEKGGWQDSDDSDTDSDGEDEDNGRGDWDLERMRRETEAERERKEQERLGGGKVNGVDDGDGVGEVTNGVDHLEVVEEEEEEGEQAEACGTNGHA